ncbi:MAG: ATP-binding protein [Phycisphaerae bacterium]|nr:ATP-binding protein [Phycisphaerae bacterium]
MLEIVILIGLQASGKSTFRRQRFEGTHDVVSKDHFPNNRRPQRRQMELVEVSLASGRSVVVDNTNPRRADRQVLLELAQRFGARAVGFYLSSRLEDSIRRNAGRSGNERVPDVALLATAKVLERPSLTEGFDELYYVSISDGSGFVVQSYVESRQ